MLIFNVNDKYIYNLSKSNMSLHIGDILEIF